MPTVRDELIRIHEDTGALVSLVEGSTDISNAKLHRIYLSLAQRFNGRLRPIRIRRHNT